MHYKDIIEQAHHDGVTSEKAMWSSVERVEDILSAIKESHPGKYWKFMRDTHEDLYGPHYNKDFANLDVQQITYIDEDGNEHEGAKWTKDEIVSETRNKVFPEGTTDWDKFVAYNASYADFCRKFNDEQIFDIAYLFFFDDSDYSGRGKIWEYMTTMQY